MHMNSSSHQVLMIPIRRHIFDSALEFQTVLDGIYSGISRPDFARLFDQLGATESFDEFTSLVEQAQGSAGLMRFLELDLDQALVRDPRVSSPRRLVRLIAGNPVTMEAMTRHAPDAGSYAPVSILVQERPEGGCRVAYDSVVSAIEPYGKPAASQVAEELDNKVLSLLREATSEAIHATLGPGTSQVSAVAGSAS
jgi:uncharacterized protein (DUF302 family)